MAAREGRGDARAASSTHVLYDLADGLRARRGRAVAVPAGDGAAHPRGARPAARPRLGERRVRRRGRRRAASRRRSRSSRASSAPTPRRDRHPRAPRRVRRPARGARRAGARRGSRADPRRSGRRSSRAATALALAERERGRLRDPRHPPARGRRRRRSRRLDELRELLGHPTGGRASGRPASTSSATTRRTTRSASCSTRQLALAAELGKPVVIHTRAADADTLEALARLRRHRRPALLLVAGAAARPALERGWYVSFAGNVTYPEGARAARWRRRRCPPTACSPRPTRPYLAPQPRRGRPNEPAYVVHTLAALAEARGEDPAELEAQIEANAAAVLRPAVSRDAPPKKELGQHFLVDENILGVIGRLAELDAGGRRARDRAGPRRPDRATSPSASRYVHAVELDRSLEPHAARALAARRTSTSHFGDALRARPRRARPAADEARRRTCRTTSRRRSSPRASTACRRVELWCVMVQREVADRFFAVPATKAYGAVSVLVQLAAERTGFHPVSRTVFRPRPNVDSALVAFRRRGPLPERYAAVKRSSTAAFAHRRKTLPNSLALAGLALARARGRGARGDRPRPERPRRGARTAGVRRARGGAPVRRAPAPAKINLALVVGPPRAGRQARGRDRAPAGRPRRPRRSSSPRPTLSVDGVRRRHARPLGARRRSPRRPASQPRWHGRDHEADPGRGRSRRRQLRRRDRAPARERDARPSRSPPSACTRSPARLGADVPFFLAPGPQLGEGDGTRPRRRSSCRRTTAVLLLLPHGAAKQSTAAVYRRLRRTRRRRRATSERRAALLERARARSGGRATSPRCRPTTSPPRRWPTSCARSAPSAPTSPAPARPSTGSSHDRRDAQAAQRALEPRGRLWITVPAWYF